jgi:hypothetical protein
MAMISPEDYRRVEARLQDLIAHGTPLGEALRMMHCEEQIGQMLLWPAVSRLCNVEKADAMRIVIRETGSPER